MPSDTRPDHLDSVPSTSVANTVPAVPTGAAPGAAPVVDAGPHPGASRACAGPPSGLAGRPPHVLAAPGHPDPYAWYAALLDGPPLVFDAGRNLWIASRADVVRAALSDPTLRVRPTAEPVPRAIAGTSAGEVFGLLVRMNDGPAAHDVPKGAIQRLLAGADLARVAADTEAIAREAAGGPAGLRGDALTQWMWRVPVMAVAAWMGFARAELPEVARLTGDFVACLSPLSTPDQLGAASEAASALMTRLDALLPTSAASPASPLARVQGLAAEAGWADARGLLANLAGLLSQTCEATAGLLGNSVVALARQPRWRAAAQGDASLWRAFVDEVGRHDPAIHNTRRFVAEATTLGGVALQPGDAVLLVLAAAGRDARLHDRPDAFMPHRPPSGMPGFGHGAHRCPGQAMACTVVAAALQAVWGQGDATPPLPTAWHYRPSPNARIPVFTA